MKFNITRNCFILAGLSNIFGVLICSKLFTNQVMMDAQPEVASYLGLISIILWGIAYIAVSKTYIHVPILIALFAFEKLVYVIFWIMFIHNNSLSVLYEKDFFAGLFYTIYGVNDFVFMVFFIAVLWFMGKSDKKKSST